ncbi:MAG: PP2C family protein-serine/threonine phosphatase, partial [Planctomycetota bacterium]
MQRLEALRQHCNRDPCATLVLTSSPVETEAALLADDTSPIGFACGLSADELAGRLTAMCLFQRPFNKLRTELEELRQRDRLRSQGLYHLDEQMRLAGQIQRDLLPDPLPQIEGARIHTLYRPADSVSGDLYDVARLDACHVALSFADATGHGLPAALLTMLARRALQATPGGNGRDALRRPQDVLAELNREILGADLSQCQFLSGLYAVYDENSGALCWARGGSP